MAYILILDSDVAAREQLTDALGARGHRAVCVSDASATLLQIQNQTPDLLLVNLDRPMGGGLTVLRILRRDPRHYLLPVLVILSAGNTANQHALNLGARSSVSSSAPVTQIADAIEQAMKDIV